MIHRSMTAMEDHGKWRLWCMACGFIGERKYASAVQALRIAKTLRELPGEACK